MITEKMATVLITANAIDRVEVVQVGAGATRGYQVDLHGRNVDVLSTARGHIKVFASLESCLKRLAVIGWRGPVIVHSFPMEYDQ